MTRALTVTARVIAGGSILVLALYFAGKYALHYLPPGGDAARVFAENQIWIRVHIIAGLGALFGGLAQFRTGPLTTFRRTHRWTGRMYVSCVAVGSAAATQLLFTPHGSWVYASGLAGLVIAWLGSTGLAYVAIRSGQVLQHREWMLRSYVVTFAFVTFRLLSDTMVAMHIGTGVERRAFASWFCWAAPLLIVELVIQGRKILGPLTTQASHQPV